MTQTDTSAPVLDTFVAIEQRRSVKHYDASHTMPDADVERLIQLAMLSPTSFNMQNWRFVVVRDSALRQQLREAAWGQAQLTDASAVFFLCGDLNAHANDPARYWRNAPQNVQDMMVPMIGKFYTDQPQLQRDEAMRSCGIAGQVGFLNFVFHLPCRGLLFIIFDPWE